MFHFVLCLVGESSIARTGANDYKYEETDHEPRNDHAAADGLLFFVNVDLTFFPIFSHKMKLY